MSEAVSPYTNIFYSLTVQYCTGQDLLFVIKKEKIKIVTLTRGARPSAGALRAPRVRVTLLIFSFCLHILDPVLA